MKCIDCTNYYIPLDETYPEWCHPDGEDDKEEKCENFSIRCDLCNKDRKGFESKDNECCKDLIIAREEKNLPCCKHLDRCNENCPGRVAPTRT